MEAQDGAEANTCAVDKMLLNIASGHRGATMEKPIFTEYLQGNWPSQAGSHVYSGTGID